MSSTEYEERKRADAAVAGKEEESSSRSQSCVCAVQINLWFIETKAKTNRNELRRQQNDYFVSLLFRQRVDIFQRSQ